MTKLEFVYFDVGNVLLLFHGGLQKLADKHGKKFEEFEHVFLKYDDLVCRGKMTSQDLWGKYMLEVGIFEPDFDFADYWISCCVPITETFELVNYLHNRGIKVGLLSNLYTDIYDVILRKRLFPFTSWDQKIISSEVQLAKPDESIYKIAEESANVAQNKILFIDDKQDFLDPASKRGWNTFKFDYNNPKESISKLLTKYELK